MKISKKFGTYSLALFFLVPLLAGGLFERIGFQDVGFVIGWAKFYKAALEISNSYAFVASLYVLASPLAIIWVHSRANLQEMSGAKAFLVSCGGGVIAGILVYIVLVGPPLSALESPTRGISLIIRMGGGHVPFSLMFGCLVMVAAFMTYASVYILFHLINAIYKDMSDDR